jgi:hypothetical protein
VILNYNKHENSRHENLLTKIWMQFRVHTKATNKKLIKVH